MLTDVTSLQVGQNTKLWYANIGPLLMTNTTCYLGKKLPGVSQFQSSLLSDK